MYASASTWLFNVARQVLRASLQTEPRVAFISGKEQSVPFDGPKAVTLVKSHEISTEARILDVARRSSKILISVRDPRDAVVSLMQAHGYNFEQALNYVEQSSRLCVEFSQDSRAKLFKYEEGFFEDIDTIRAVARHLGMQLEDDTIQTIYDSLTRNEVEKHISQMPRMAGVLKSAASGDLLEIKTQWHSHHAGRNGAIGKWKRTLTAQQVAGVERRLSLYFEKLCGPPALS
jgi:hypothetical protein